MSKYLRSDPKLIQSHLDRVGELLQDLRDDLDKLVGDTSDRNGQTRRVPDHPSRRADTRDYEPSQHIADRVFRLEHLIVDRGEIEGMIHEALETERSKNERGVGK